MSTPSPPRPRAVRRIAHGDWQTPDGLASQVLSLLQRSGVSPASIVEPTCGRGAFVKAAAATFSSARVVGYELSGDHLRAARTALAHAAVELHQADFFTVAWEDVLAELPDPILLLGNPPWVTSATLGALASANHPAKSNFKKHRGLDARTGRANFDISEWMMLRLLGALRGRDVTLAMLCKSAVARNVLGAVSADRAVEAATYAIDARAHFEAAVDAVLLVLRASADAGAGTTRRWAVFPAIDAPSPTHHMGVLVETFYRDLDAVEDTRALQGRCEIEWRSGIKHDCAAVMELTRRNNTWTNGLGEVVDIEEDRVFPMMKGSEVANGVTSPTRWMLVPQRALGEDTASLRTSAPKTWAYLTKHRARLDARKSSIYQKQPPFAVFGVGAYSFAPYKVAICGLYKRLTFRVVAPSNDRPVVLDDTSYFLPCASAEQAERIARALNGERAQAFFQARVFWDAKRPIHKALLQTLSLEALLRAEGDDEGVLPRGAPSIS